MFRSFPAHVSQIRAFHVPHMALTRNRPTREAVRIPEAPAEDEEYGDVPHDGAEGSESDVIRAPPVELPVEAGALDRPRRDRKVPVHLRDFELRDSDE